MEISFLEILKVIFLGIVEGVTEWLPISSTGHMYLVDFFIRLDMSEAFKNLFMVVIQLGAILAVVVLFWKKLFPFRFKEKPVVQKDIFSLWGKVLVACLPAGILGILFDDFLDEHVYTENVRLIVKSPYIKCGGEKSAAMLIVYGIAFIVVEKRNKNRLPRIDAAKDIDYKTALIIGAFQVLSLIPGTSRSGATILGAILVGVSRPAAAEFTFFLAIPVMFGASLLKIVKFGLAFTGTEILLLSIGCAVAFVVSLFAIKFLMNFVKKHDFTPFGWYRIILGAIVLFVAVPLLINA